MSTKSTTSNTVNALKKQKHTSIYVPFVRPGIALKNIHVSMCHLYAQE